MEKLDEIEVKINELEVRKAEAISQRRIQYSNISAEVSDEQIQESMAMRLGDQSAAAVNNLNTLMVALDPKVGSDIQENVTQIVLSANTTFEEFKAEQQINVKKMIDHGIEQFKREFLEQQFNSEVVRNVEPKGKGGKASTTGKQHTEAVGTAAGKGKGKAPAAAASSEVIATPPTPTPVVTDLVVQEAPIEDLDLDTEVPDAKKAGATTASQRDAADIVSLQASQVAAAKRHRSLNPRVKTENKGWGYAAEAFIHDEDDDNC